MSIGVLLCVAAVGLPAAVALPQRVLGDRAAAAAASEVVRDGPAAAGQTFVHLFEWSWEDIAIECEQFLGPMGYSAVQVSPPNEHITGDQWWTRYQPVSYNLTSRSGSAAQFKDMVAKCNKAGVNIYADSVINHMAAGSGTGVGGTSFSSRSFSPLYSQGDFHHNNNDQSSNCVISDYDDLHNVQFCDLVGLPDLCTECSNVQNNVAQYLEDLRENFGVGGYRVDAAKHQQANALGSIVTKGVGGLFLFTEVIAGAGEAVTPDMYYGIGHVTEFGYGQQVGSNVLQSNKMQYFSTFGESWGLMPTDKAVVFLDNHDTQRGNAVLTYKDGALYTLANVFMLAHPYGYPKVMSSFAFNDHDQGPPHDPVHTSPDPLTGVNCGKGEWVCEHRQPAIAGMVRFRSVSAGAPVAQFNSGLNGNAIAFGRQGKAFVAINRDPSQTWTATLPTTLGGGNYNDVISTNNQTVMVSGDGKVSINLPPMSAMAFHIASQV